MSTHQDTRFDFRNVGVEDGYSVYRATLDCEPDEWDVRGFEAVLDWLLANTDGRFQWTMNHAVITNYVDTTDRLSSVHKLEANEWKLRDKAIYTVWIKAAIEDAFKQQFVD